VLPERQHGQSCQHGAGEGSRKSVQVAEARSHVLLACVTNPLTDYQFTDVASMLKHCESTFTQLKSFIAEGRAAVPGDLEQVR